MKYQQLFNECLNGGNNFELLLKINMYLVHYMGEFVKYSKNIVKEIIDDIFKKTKKFNLNQFIDSNKKKIEHYFTYEDDKNQTSIKIAWSECKRDLQKDQLFYDEEQIKLLGKGLFLKSFILIFFYVFFRI